MSKQKANTVNFVSLPAMLQCPQDYMWVFDQGSKCCSSLVSNSGPFNLLGFLDLEGSCRDGDFIECSDRLCRGAYGEF